MKSFFEATWFTKLIISLAVLLVALVIFFLGTLVGFKQAEYSSRWAGHYTEVFGNMRPPFMAGIAGPDGDDVVSTGGAIGTVMAVSLPTIAVKNANEVEKVVILGPNTVIRKFRSPATTTDIHLGDFLMTVGAPDDQGRIVASFVRIMPPIPTSTDPRNTMMPIPAYK